MTIEEYAAKWAVQQFNSENNGLPDCYRDMRRQVYFDWAVRDEDSPISAALASGESKEFVQDQFSTAFNNMLQMLAKMS